MTEIERQLLALRPTVRVIALGFRRRMPTGMESEDLISVGMAAAWSVLADGGDERLVPGLVRWRIEDELRRWTWGSRRHPEAFMTDSLDAVPEERRFDPWRQRGGFWAAAEQEEAVAEHRQREALERALVSLPERSRYVLLRRLRGDTTATIARSLGVTQPRVTQISTKAVRMVREAMGQNGISSSDDAA